MRAYHSVTIRVTQAEVDGGALNGLPVGVTVIMPNNEVRVVDSTGSAQAVQTAGNQPLSNFTATTDPTANDDSGDGYAVGSRWINLTADESYICTDATVGAALWSRTTVSTIGEIAGLQTALNLKQDAATAATDAELATHTGNVNNPHAVTKAQVGLGSAENTSDANKPVSTVTQTALNGKANTVHTHAESDVTNLTTDLAAKAPLASPSLTGTPTSPTATAGTNTTQLATTAFVLDAVTSSQAGLDWKQSVRAATTANITLSGVQTIDGVVLVAGNRVLVKNQTTASQNGLYDVAAGAWVRSADANANNEVSAGISVYVEEGTTSATTVWTLVTAGNISLGTTALTFSRLFNTSGLQETLVSGTNIKTVNNASLLGAGNVVISPDLPGGVSATAFDDGLDAGNSVVDRATVSGQTILKYQTVGSSTFKVPLNVTSIQYLVVAGGGGGGTGRYAGDSLGRPGGGGGAGGLLESVAFVVTPGQSLAVTVGAGGAGATDTNDTDAGAGGINGGNSVLGTVTAIGGGHGGGHKQDIGTGWDVPAATGGSGGGSSNGSAGVAGTAGQGNAGGNGALGTFAAGGGGGGAGGVGGNGNGTNGAAGAGGIALSKNITGVSVNYAAGGDGSSGTLNGHVGANATANSGNGGQAAYRGGSDGRAVNTSAGGAGGSGIVIVRFITQSRTYQALTAFANDAAAAIGGILVGQFYRDSVTGATRQRVS